MGKSWLEQRALKTEQRVGKTKQKVYSVVDGKSYRLYPVSHSINRYIDHELRTKYGTDPSTVAARKAKTTTGQDSNITTSADESEGTTEGI